MVNMTVFALNLDLAKNFSSPLNFNRTSQNVHLLLKTLLD